MCDAVLEKLSSYLDGSSLSLGYFQSVYSQDKGLRELLGINEDAFAQEVQDLDAEMGLLNRAMSAEGRGMLAPGLVDSMESAPKKKKKKKKKKTAPLDEDLHRIQRQLMGTHLGNL